MDRDTGFRGSAPTVASPTAARRCAEDWLGNGSTSRGLVAQLTNLGGACDRALKLENVLRTHGSQLTARDSPSEFVAVGSQASTRTRVGDLLHQAP